MLTHVQTTRTTNTCNFKKKLCERRQVATTDRMNNNIEIFTIVLLMCYFFNQIYYLDLLQHIIKIKHSGQ